MDDASDRSSADLQRLGGVPVDARTEVSATLRDDYGRYRGLLHARPVLAPGSALANAWHPDIEYDPATLFWAPMFSTADALVGLHVLWSTSDPSPPVMSSNSLLRQALIGASTTRWLCADASQEELRRRLGMLSLESMKNHKHLDGARLRALAHAGSETRAMRQALKQNDAAHERVMGRLAKTVFDTDWQHARQFNLNDAIVEAIRATRPEDPFAHYRATVAWRTMSGDAHALPWAHVFRALDTGTTVPSPENSDRLIAPVAIDFDDYLATLHDIREMLEQAIKLGASLGIDVRSWLDNDPTT